MLFYFYLKSFYFCVNVEMKISRINLFFIRNNVFKNKLKKVFLIKNVFIVYFNLYASN